MENLYFLFSINISFFFFFFLRFSYCYYLSLYLFFLILKRTIASFSQFWNFQLSFSLTLLCVSVKITQRIFHWWQNQQTHTIFLYNCRKQIGVNNNLIGTFSETFFCGKIENLQSGKICTNEEGLNWGLNANSFVINKTHVHTCLKTVLPQYNSEGKLVFLFSLSFKTLIKLYWTFY